MASSLLERPIGIYEKALAPGPWPAMFDAAARAGFDFIEMSIDESDQRLERLRWSREERLRLAAESRAQTMPIFSICLSGHRRYGLGSADAAVRARAAEILDAAVALACDLGVRVVQIAGYYSYYEPADPGARARYVDGLRRGISLAARRGVMLAVENIDTPDMPSISACLALRDELASPWFQIYPDVGNLVVHRLDAIGEVALLAGSAVGLHLKDARENEPRRVPFGSGSVPFASVFATIAGGAYAGPFTIEMWNDDPTNAVETAGAARHWIRTQIEAGVATAAP